MYAISMLLAQVYLSQLNSPNVCIFFSPQAKKEHKEIQCVMSQESPPDDKLHDQFRETVKLNSRLAEDLGSAKKEIEVLKGRLRELEVCVFNFMY